MASQFYSGGEQICEGNAAAMLNRNSTSYPVQVSARLRDLYNEYRALLVSEAGSPEHRAAAGLKYYQFLVRAVMTNPEFGVGECGNARGLLIYHTMGMGKTLLAVATAMALWDVRAPLVLVAKTLQKNFIHEIEKFVQMMNPDLSEDALKIEQAAAVRRFKFASIDAYNMATQVANATTGTEGSGTLNNRLLIVDEAHNLFRGIINSPSETTNARRLYEMVMNAQNLRILFLTGTPASKDPFELVPCFNMLAGYDLLPTQYEVFYKHYVNQAEASIRNRGKLANRLLGLVSHVTHTLPSDPDDAKSKEGPKLREVGGFPEEIETVIERVEMSAEQYRQYLLAREKEEAEGKGGEGGFAPSERITNSPALSLPGSEAGAGSTYYVKSRALSNFTPPRDERGHAVETMLNESFNEESSPKASRLVANLAKSSGPALIYSQFTGVGGLAVIARFLRNAGYEEFVLPPTPKAAKKPKTGGADSLMDFVRDSTVTKRIGGVGLCNGGAGGSKKPEPEVKTDKDGGASIEAIFRRAREEDLLVTFIDPRNEYGTSFLKAPTHTGPKPSGGKILWLSLPSVEDNSWYEWASDEMPEWVDLDTKAVVGYRVDQDKLLRVSTLEELEAFEKKYAVCLAERDAAFRCEKTIYALDWEQVSKEFPGVAFDPYMTDVARAKNTRHLWYSALDSVTYIVWDPAVVSGTVVLHEPARRPALAAVRASAPASGVVSTDTFSVDDCHYYDTQAAWALTEGVPSEKIRTQQLAWMLDEPQWDARLSARDVLDDPESYPDHAARIDSADLSYPLLVVDIPCRGVDIPCRGVDIPCRGVDFTLADGMHRLARAVRDKVETVNIRRIPPEVLEKTFMFAEGEGCVATEQDNETSNVLKLAAECGEVPEAYRHEVACVTKHPQSAYSPWMDADKRSRHYVDQDKQGLYRFDRLMNLHRGQRKLFLSELQVLTQMLEQATTSAVVVYAGAAGGHHLPYLAKLFPAVVFHLYDPAPFRFKRENTHLHTHNEYFTDEVAQRWTGRCDIFICDIRVSHEDRDQFEAQVAEDMTAQARWMRIIAPHMGAMLKFRPPYYTSGEKLFKYPPGRVLWQMWGPKNTTEGRFVASANEAVADPIDWDAQAHQDSCFYHNTILRPWARYHRPEGYEKALDVVPGYDDCCDCAGEAHAWAAYLTLPGSYQQGGVAARMENLTRAIRQPLVSAAHPPYHGVWPDLSAEAGVRLALKQEGCAGAGRHDLLAAVVDIGSAVPVGGAESADKEAPRYAIISGDVKPDDRVRIQAVFNSPANAHGELIRALLISKTGAEGLDLKGVRQVHIFEPYWDKSREDQVKARGVRLGSHDHLPVEEREVRPFLYVSVANQEMFEGMQPTEKEGEGPPRRYRLLEEITIDEKFHTRAVTKQTLNSAFRQLLRDVCLECSINGYGGCRLCVPTDAPLFHEDPIRDLRLPDPCRPLSEAEVSVQEIILPGDGEPTTYFYREDPTAPFGVRFFMYDDELEAYSPVDPSAGLFMRLLGTLRGDES